jgi:hypothetical protein
MTLFLNRNENESKLLFVVVLWCWVLLWRLWFQLGHLLFDPGGQQFCRLDRSFQHGHDVSLVFDATSELRRAQLQDSRFFVEPVADDFAQNESFCLGEGDVPNVYLQDDPVFHGSHKRSLQQPSKGRCFEL